MPLLVIPLMSRGVRPDGVPEVLPKLDLQPRVARDIEQLANFVARQPWGNSVARRRDIEAGIAAILHGPELNEVSVRRRTTSLELRRQNAAQFAIVYAYYQPSDVHPQGLVSVRAVRHSREKNVFLGVRETPQRLYGLIASLQDRQREPQ